MFFLFTKVKNVQDYRYNAERKRGEWLIRWQNCSSDEDTWEPWGNLLGDDVRNEAKCVYNTAKKRKIRNEEEKKVKVKFNIRSLQNNGLGWDQGLRKSRNC